MWNLAVGMTILFIALKLTKVITWGWLAVFAPMWITVVGVGVFLAGAILLAGVIETKNK